MMRLQKFLLLPSILILMAALVPLNTVLADDLTTEPSVTVVEDTTVTTTEEDVTTVEEEPQNPATTEEPASTAEATTTTEEPIIPFAKEAPNLKANDPSKVVALLPDLVGSWVGYRGGVAMTIVIHPDGSGTATIEAHNGWRAYTSEFKIDQLELVTDNLYRYVGGSEWGSIGFGGFGGWGVKYDWGFSFTNGKFQPVVWQAAVKDDFDYTKACYQEEFTKVADDTPNPPAIPIVNPTPKQGQQRRVKPTLPKTGEIHSLLPVLGIFLLTGTGIFLKKGKK